MIASVRATGWLTLALMRRSIREGIVLRSLVVPGAIAVFGTLATMLVTTWMLPAARIAVDDDAPIEVVDRIEALGGEPVAVPDVMEALHASVADVGISRGRLLVDLRGAQPLGAEHIARHALGGRWLPATSPRATQDRIPPTGPAQAIVRMLVGLFCLYGVVFGAGGIARDRSMGLLDAELVVGLPHVAIGMARWLASVTVVALPLVATIAAVDAVVWVEGAATLGWHGVAGVAASVSVGMVAIGQADLDKGFSGPLALGLGSLAALFSAGLTPGLGSLVPVGSILLAGPATDPLPALGASLVMSALGWWSFATRTAQA